VRREALAMIQLAALVASPIAKVSLAVGAVAALFLGGLYVGYRIGSRALPEAVAAQQIDFTKTMAKRWELTDQFTVVYVDRIKTVEAETQTIIKKVPFYVKDTCTLSPGLRVFHDAAAEGRLPTSQRGHADLSQAIAKAAGGR
jgi:hypothetical protein